MRIILSAQTYHDKYLTDIEHDNVYVTSYFRKIDARRKARGSVTLLPLKKIERPGFADPYGLRPSEVERVRLTGQTVKLILEMISVTTFILLDRLFFEALDLVRRHAHMEYTQVRSSLSNLRNANLRLFFFQLLLSRNSFEGFKKCDRISRVSRNMLRVEPLERISISLNFGTATSLPGGSSRHDSGDSRQRDDRLSDT